MSHPNFIFIIDWFWRSWTSIKCIILFLLLIVVRKLVFYIFIVSMNTRIKLILYIWFFLFQPVVTSSDLIAKGRSYKFLWPWLGLGLLTSSGIVVIIFVLFFSYYLLFFSYIGKNTLCYFYCLSLLYACISISVDPELKIVAKVKNQKISIEESDM